MRTSATLLAAWICLAVASSALAQTSGTSLFGERSFGSGTSSTRNSLGASIGGTPGNRTTSAQADVGQVTGSERFLRENRQPGQFVGADNTDAANLRSQAQGQNFGGLGGLGPLGAFANQNQFNPQGQGNTANQRTVRTPIRLGFTPSRTPPAQLAGRLQVRFTKIPQLENAAVIAVQVQGKTVVLSGVAASDYARDLAARLAMLEPGVGAVQNDLIVDPEAAMRSPVAPQN